MSNTNTERRNAAPGLRIRTKSGEVLDLAEIRDYLNRGLLVAPPRALLDALEAALSVPRMEMQSPAFWMHNAEARAHNASIDAVRAAAGVIENDTPALPPWLTRDQAIEAAKAAYPEHGELRVVSYEASECEGKPIWYVVVSNGERETSVAFPRLVEEKAS